MDTSLNKCLVCGHKKLEKLTTLVSEFVTGVFHNVVICRMCGHVQLDPLFTETEYMKINSAFFGYKYLMSGKENPDNSRKLEKLDLRIKKYLKNGQKVLDVGAGEGWAFEYSRKYNLEYYAIEPIEKLASNLKLKGARVIGDSLFDNYENYLGKFDIILFRHALEHMLDPLKALNALKSFLSDNGLLYLVVPNCNIISVKKGVRTSFLRPVHISYFHESNLLYLAGRANLKPEVHGAESECWALLKVENYPQRKLQNVYVEQKKIFKKAIRLALVTDYLKTLKILMKQFIGNK